jgi:hypothetical protein
MDTSPVRSANSEITQEYTASTKRIKGESKNISGKVPENERKANQSRLEYDVLQLAMRQIAIILGLLAFDSFAVASWEHVIVHHTGAPRRIEGTVTDYTGSQIPWVEIEVYDHPEVWDDASLSVVAMRAKQKKIASGTADENGHFKIGHVRKGSYEVQFMRLGWSTLSVLLNIDPHGEKLCTELRISGGAGENRVTPCH